MPVYPGALRFADYPEVIDSSEMSFPASYSPQLYSADSFLE
jgi:hypothetical protein